MQIVFSAAAQKDLAKIEAYIGAHNPHAASRLAIRLIAACDRLEYLPHRGRPGLVPGTREITTVKPYVIVYRVKGDTVEIARIWHGAQNR